VGGNKRGSTPGVVKVPLTIATIGACSIAVNDDNVFENGFRRIRQK
jgi:hypothetical protein